MTFLIINYLVFLAFACWALFRVNHETRVLIVILSVIMSVVAWNAKKIMTMEDFVIEMCEVKDDKKN